MRHILPLILAAFASAATAQDSPNTILVMDGSGSMWGQIDGVAKITIAQEVVAGLMETIPADQNIGLTVYGHRERGNCTDIETVVPPGPGTRAAIVDAVNAIKPLGKTPMTDSIIAAAEALRYTEDSATVILVSDGVETCNPDPCAAMRLLEEAAIDFTAHVVGFDVGSDAVALQQMQCIADETGGQFLTADNAEELGQALQTVAAEPEPVLVDMTFTAVIGDDKRVIESPVLWDINAGDGLVIEDAQDNPYEASLEEGAYVATAYAVALEETVNVNFVVIEGGTATVEAVFEEPPLTARLIVPDTVPGGMPLPIGWDGPNDQYDNVQIFDADGEQRYDFLYTERGNPLTFIAPFDVGTYRAVYAHKDSDVIGTASFQVTESPVGLDAPAEVSIGAEFQVGWTGPNAHGDNVQIGPVGEQGYSSFAYTDRGNPVTLKAPGDAGDYELRYKFRDRQVIYTQPITVVDVQATVTAPDAAVAGSTISVDWSGPDAELDYIGIGQVGATGADPWENFFYTRDGSPSALLVPTEPGDYVISYFLGQGRKVLASHPITVTPVTATLNAPAEATAGSTIALDWTGPDYDLDYVGIGRVGATGAGPWENFFYTRDGSPGDLLIPTTPGDYQISYFFGQNRDVLVTVPIVVTDVTASITAPTEAIAGSNTAITWTGPNYARDYVGIGKVGASGPPAWENFFYTEDAAPTADLLVPTEPGDYIVSYFSGQDRSVLASAPLTVTEVKASLDAPAEAVGGSTIEVTWQGPNYTRDYIGIGKTDASGPRQWENFVYTEDGSPASLLVPVAPGDYLITYFLGQDRAILKARPITVTAVKARLIAAASGAAGTELVVGWDGPDYDRDYIGIGQVGASGPKQWESFAYTRNGNPATLTLPDTPGDYVITYFAGQDRSAIATLPFTIE